MAVVNATIVMAVVVVVAVVVAVAVLYYQAVIVMVAVVADAGHRSQKIARRRRMGMVVVVELEQHAGGYGFLDAGIVSPDASLRKTISFQNLQVVDRITPRECLS